MDQKVEIKQEPVWLEGTASTSFEFESANSYLKEESKPEPEPTQPAVDIKDEITIEEQTLDQLVPLLKEEDRSSESLYLHGVAVPKRLKSPMLPQTRLCGKSSTKRHLEKHMVVHTGQRLIRFTKRGHKPDLKQHAEIRNGQRLHVCINCGKTFPRMSHLKRHALMHTEERPHVCIQCNKTFPRKASLKRHALLHTGERPYVCIQCGKTFSQKENLGQHALIHTENKPHLCISCGRTFSHKSTFKRHVLIHTGERPHICIQCGKAFSRKSHLKRHALIHSGEATCLNPV